MSILYAAEQSLSLVVDLQLRSIAPGQDRNSSGPEAVPQVHDSRVRARKILGKCCDGDLNIYSGTSGYDIHRPLKGKSITIFVPRRHN